jgi:hypothetical protein
MQASHICGKAATEPADSHCDESWALDSQVPGGVYLCQVNARVSCGACCGLYNVADLSRESLSRMLALRTRRFARTPRTVMGIEAFARTTAAAESQARPFAELHHCPFIGLIGEPPGRVGCLLHPLGEGNHGVDFRGLSYYGGMACRTYFCATTKKLRPRWKLVLRQVSDEWYLFGLVVTEMELLTAIFEHLESRMGQPLDGSMVVQTSAGTRLKQLLSLKCRWPFRPPSHGTACHYLFDDNAYPKPVVDYHRLGTAPSLYDSILCQMPSDFRSEQALRRAEALVESHLTAAAQALSICGRLG